jgi:hypothetical protein
MTALRRYRTRRGARSITGDLTGSVSIEGDGLGDGDAWANAGSLPSTARLRITAAAPRAARAGVRVMRFLLCSSVSRAPRRAGVLSGGKRRSRREGKVCG